MRGIRLLLPFSPASRQCRFLHTCGECSSPARVVQTSSKSAYLNRVLDEAEKVVGCRRQYFDVSNMIHNDFPMVALNSLNKIAAANNPIVEFSRKLSRKDHDNIKSRGIVLLLLSKMVGINPDSLVAVHQAHRVDPETGILPHQRCVAEATEIITSALMAHNGILSVPLYHRSSDNSGCAFPPNRCLEDNAQADHEVHENNKISILSGDYLLATSMKILSETKSSEVLRLMARAITDSMEGQFMAFRGRSGIPLPLPEMNVDDWETKSYTFLGSILAHSCQAEVSLAGHGQYPQQQAFEFGRNVAHAWQAHEDLQPFTGVSNRTAGSHFDLTSAPVILHLEDDSKMLDYIRNISETTEEADYDLIYREVSNGDGVAKTRALLEFYVQRALDIIEPFSPSAAKRALSNMVLALRK